VTYISLFSGCLGGDLGCQHLLGWKCKGYVEIDDYCQRVIRRRIKDGFTDDAPIFSDIRTFISDGYAESYQGMVDCVTAGFPCQPFSVAGQRRGADDERNMWPATIECIRLVRPRYCLLENVPGLLVHKYFGTILGDLAKSGFDARWAVLPAYITGAPQVGKRLWIVAEAVRERLEGIQRARGCVNLQSVKTNVPNKFWKTLPRVYRTGNGMAHRLERTKALGNGQVSAVAATAWRLLNSGA